MGYVPGTAVLLGMKLSVAVVLVLEAENEAVMPAGTPDAARLTLPAKFSGFTTLMVVLGLTPLT
jgi:hypothetical protein